MLLLSRRPGEAIVFPTLGITVRILAVRGNAVRLDIEAPPDVPITREELLKAAAAPLLPSSPPRTRLEAPVFAPA